MLKAQHRKKKGIEKLALVLGQKKYQEKAIQGPKDTQRNTTVIS